MIVAEKPTTKNSFVFSRHTVSTTVIIYFFTNSPSINGLLPFAIALPCSKQKYYFLIQWFTFEIQNFAVLRCFLSRLSLSLLACLTHNNTGCSKSLGHILTFNMSKTIKEITMHLIYSESLQFQVFHRMFKDV